MLQQMLHNVIADGCDTLADSIGVLRSGTHFG